jgi:hypothetical protein
MQLQLQAHWQVIRDDPVGQVTRIQVMVTRRKQYFASTPVQAVLDQLGDSPVIVFAGTDDEFDLVIGGQQFDVFVAIALDLLRSRCFQVDNPADPRVYRDTS